MKVLWRLIDGAMSTIFILLLLFLVYIVVGILFSLFLLIKLWWIG